MNNIELLIGAYIEVFLMVGGGLGLIGIRPKLSRIAVMAGIMGAIVVGVRNFYIYNKIPFGTHSFILMVFMTTIIHKIGKQTFLDSTVATLASFLLLFWGEGVFFFPILKFLHFDPFTTMGAPGMRLLGILLSDVLLIIAFVMCYLFKVTLIDLKKFHYTEKM
ncbi:MAG: hypothetical protein ACOYVK_07490 [Bacillota bacterium]